MFSCSSQPPSHAKPSIQLTHSLQVWNTSLTLIVLNPGPGKLPTRLLLNIYYPNARVSDAPSTPITDNNWHRRGVSKVLKTIEITLGPPSTISATTGQPWPIPALKKEKKRKKKREKNTKNQQTKETKETKKHKLKLLSMGRKQHMRKGITQSENLQKTLQQEFSYQRVH